MSKRPLILWIPRKSLVWVGVFVIALAGIAGLSALDAVETLGVAEFLKLRSLDPGGSERPAQEPIAPLTGLLIVLDPGHGGDDRGVCHFESDLIEKEINLDLALRLQEQLEKAGARVLLTRADDTFVPLDERARIANDAEAHLFLSLHVNRIPGHPDCFGAQAFYFPGSKEGERLAQLLQEELIKIDPENYRSPLPGNYRVLRLTTMPGALVEIGFMTSARDRELIATAEYRDQVAMAITQGVIRFFTESPPPPRR
ncbi:MAG TPA: N-acetylmuramoyl-L-alanine amidase [Limnochordia bacterium]|nr:N-acetylmuramoyl-L-alanine amidase [Limnochordia bacterium]